MTPETFKEVREALGLTQAEVADLLGYGHPSRISEIENGRRKPGDTVLLLLKAYRAGYRPENWPGRA